ncbi:phosphotransferase [Microbacterium rhizophilus]|uniref:phosphotransferase n=1 Tax=Microbacterium rhizophilus TaxID=3138934 RepID=UPI0031ECC28E
MDEVILTGGNMMPVVRIGDTVRRETGPWTPAVHALLDRCEAAGVEGVPRARGVDERGREVLSFVPGDVLADAAAEILWSRDVLVEAARLMRRIHDAGAGLVGAPLSWRAPAHAPAEVICHNDFAPYNLLMSGGTLAGAIDFDFASPGPRLWDVAYLAYRIAPLAEDAPGFDPERFGSPVARVGELVTAYGADWSATEVRAAAAARLDELAAFTEDRAADTGRADLAVHAVMYRRDAGLLRD